VKNRNCSVDNTNPKNINRDIGDYYGRISRSKSETTQAKDMQAMQIKEPVDCD